MPEATSTYVFSLPPRESITSEKAGELINELDEHIAQMNNLLQQLYSIHLAPRRIEEIGNEVLEFRDGTPPEKGSAVEEWPSFIQPEGVHNAYTQGRVIQWNGKLMRATRTGVVHTPDESPSDWEDVTTELAGETPPEIPSAQPFEAGEVVEVGDLREFQGVVYEVIQPHTTQADWSPDKVASLWKVYQP